LYSCLPLPEDRYLLRTDAESGRMPFCTECGTKLNDGAKFCHECGAKVPVRGPPTPAPKKASPAPIVKKKFSPKPPSTAHPKKGGVFSKYGGGIQKKFAGNTTGDGMTMPSFRGNTTTSLERKKVVKKPGWVPPAKKESKHTSGAVSMLMGHESWAFYNNKLVCKASGKGVAALKNALPMDKPGFVHFRIDAENVGNTGAGIITTANIILQWKGPNASTMAKVKCNGSLQSALNRLEPNKGYIEVLGIKNLSTQTIFDRQCLRPHLH